jgi:hypothetical protein
MRIIGNIVLPTDGSAEIQNLIIERRVSNPSFNAAEEGRAIYNTTSKVVSFNNGTSYVDLAAAGAVQTEIDAIETSLGTGVNASGVFVSGSFVGAAFGVAPTDFTDAINKVAAYAGLHDTLSELDDVNLTGLADKNLLYYDNGTSEWKNGAAGATTGVQAYDADLTTMAGFAPAVDSSEITGPITRNGLNDIMVGTGGAEGSRWTLKRGAAARTSLGMGDIAIHDDAEYVRVDGTNALTANLNAGGFQISSLAAPTVSTHAATKGYVDSLISGLKWKASVRVATTGDISLSGTQTIDGVAVIAGDRVLVRAQTSGGGAADNGIYVVAAGAWSRATDADDAAEVVNASVFVEEGTTYGDTGWTCTTNAPVVIGTTNLDFAQFTGAASFTAGIGLSQVGNVVNVNVGAGIVELPSDEIGIDLYDASTGAIILTADGSTRGTGAATKLHLLLDLGGNGRLVQSANGLKVTTNTITENELTASVAGAGLSGGNGTALSVNAGAGLGISGDDVIIATGGVTGAMLDSAIAGAGLVFNANVLDVNVGAGLAISADQVIISTGGVTNAMLANSAVSLGADSGSGTVSLGGTLTVTGGAGIASSVSGSTVTLSLEQAGLYYLYSGASSVSHTVTHNLGQKYCNVTVVDGSDNVVIPLGISYVDNNSLTVTFSVATACKVVVTGVA